ncbi:MAG: thioredoxin domain-containing protein, partial [candidate division NC10 bacterium]|nr:thioredoxin domain-containing protein [candidate division NC10 bacterium]
MKSQSFLRAAAPLVVLFLPCASISSGETGPKLVNRLATASSPYLKEAATQPIHWQPWGEEAFRLARELDRPILMDIGAIWCHWCHVMDEETYSNPEVAKLINDYFVPIRVDRDERPDIDSRYQVQVQALVSYGGWPLTVFMTPEGKVFYGGGTFFPDERYGRPGFKQLLPEVYRVYKGQKDKVLENADGLYQAVAKYQAGLTEAGDLKPRLITNTMWALLRSFDEEAGGFGGGPKFPVAGTMELALKGSFDTGDQKLLHVATKTLDAMARGGVHDQLDGGFHRYATDRQWRVPHFEKMLNDQAQLLKDYLAAYQVTGKARYREVAEGIIRYVQGSLSDQARGGFYAHQDADIGRKDDGDYYTWTEAEVRQALPKEEAEVLIRYFDIGPEGEMRENPARNVLWIARTAEEIAQALAMPVAKVEALIVKGKGDLLRIRGQRKTPFVDRTILSDRNGMMVSAYFEAYKVLGREELKDFALKSLDFLLDHAYVPGRGVVHAYAHGKATVPGFLQDQVQVAAALLEAFEVSGEARYLAVGRDIMDYAVQTFWDESGGFFDTPHQPGALGVLGLRSKPFQDGDTPAANPAAAEL